MLSGNQGGGWCLVRAGVSFSNIFTNFQSLVGCFAPGSVVLVGSLSHLRKRGISNYTDELVRNIDSLTARVGAGVEVVPLVLFPLGGIGDPGMVCDAYDFNAWITGSALGPGVGLGVVLAVL
jgi:hypothetical protein